jgi:hypothetical protein
MGELMATGLARGLKKFARRGSKIRCSFVFIIEGTVI